MHYRQRIREAIAARLADALTLARGNVFTSRARPVLEILQRREAVLSVYTADETSTDNADSHHRVRTLTVSIEGMAGGGDDLDDILDTMAGQVEAALDADDTLGTLLSKPLELTATTSEITARGNQQVGAFRMDFECQYITEFSVNPDDLLWPEQPLPTQVTINPVPTPRAYVQPISSARIEPPAAPSIFGAEPPEPVPAVATLDAVAPSRAPEPVKAACVDGSCAVPAWTGDPA